jgi:hypothetical protein
MNTTETNMNECQVDNEVVQQEASPSVSNSTRKRGRPQINVSWPEGSFTFSSLNQNNVLSSSSLRKKMRVELRAGNLVKVDTLKTAFGRPQNVYEKV